MASHVAEIEANALKGEQFCRRAASHRADIACSRRSGASDTRSTRKGTRMAAPNGSNLLSQKMGLSFQRFRRLAREPGMAIAITYLQAHAGLPRDSVTLIGPDGRDIFTYAKVHTCSWDAPEESFTGGHEFYVGDVPTRCDTAKVGAMICFDRKFPESARMLMLNGAEVILTPSAGDLVDKKEEVGDSAFAQFRFRAFENAVGAASSIRPGLGSD